MQKESAKVVAEGALGTTTTASHKAISSSTCDTIDQPFWTHLPFTRIAEWGKAFHTLQRYVLRNILEAAGVILYKRRVATQISQNRNVGLTGAKEKRGTERRTKEQHTLQRRTMQASQTQRNNADITLTKSHYANN